MLLITVDDRPRILEGVSLPTAPVPVMDLFYGWLVGMPPGVVRLARLFPPKTSLLFSDGPTLLVLGYGEDGGIVVTDQYEYEDAISGQMRICPKCTELIIEEFLDGGHDHAQQDADICERGLPGEFAQGRREGYHAPPNCN